MSTFDIAPRRPVLRLLWKRGVDGEHPWHQCNAPNGNEIAQRILRRLGS